MSEWNEKFTISIEEVADFGLIILKANFSNAKICELVKTVTGAVFPKIGKLSTGKNLNLGWMSTDEIAIILRNSEADKMARKIEKKLKGYDCLCVNMSDSRKCFKLDGYGWREILSKGTPANLNPTVFTVGSFRRTRIADVAVSIWTVDQKLAYVFVMRSVGHYVFDWLKTANLKSGQLNYY